MTNREHDLQRVETAIDTMRRAMAVARQCFDDSLQLTRTQLDILTMLADSMSTTGELASSLYLTQSAVTQTVDTLVRKSLVERRYDDHDRRIIHLDLSTQGRGLIKRVHQLRRATMEQLIERLTNDEIDALIAINEKITDLVSDIMTSGKDKVRG
jgi:DNA-binding MarR family transcriptional regulator